MHNFFQDLIDARRNNPVSEKGTPDLLDMMLAEDGIDSDDLISNIYLLFLAGHDTTSTALSWLMALLSSHPQVQERVREEVRQLELSDLTIDALDKQLPYTSAVINEGLRLHPPVYNMVSRSVPRATELGGFIIPKKTLVSIGVGAIRLKVHNLLLV
eukprot:Lithocolla_globosa_v1_NODE_106_length_6331_cov_39.598311.p5 type:complete len:157 gc:universal NODE_106_length_6331_cov_39.598311:554-84(-)